MANKQDNPNNAQILRIMSFTFITIVVVFVLSWIALDLLAAIVTTFVVSIILAVVLYFQAKRVNREQRREEARYRDEWARKVEYRRLRNMGQPAYTKQPSNFATEQEKPVQMMTRAYPTTSAYPEKTGWLDVDEPLNPWAGYTRAQLNYLANGGSLGL